MITNITNAFGWKIAHCQLTKGESVQLISKRETTLDKLSAKTIYTKGLLTSIHTTNTSLKGLDRTPGFCTYDLPDPLPEIDLIATAELDTEWWCISVPLNKNLPKVEFIRLSKGESMDISAGSLAFLCQGNVDEVIAPCSFAPLKTKTITAQEDTYGFIFDKRNENI